MCALEVQIRNSGQANDLAYTPITRFCADVNPD